MSSNNLGKNVDLKLYNTLTHAVEIFVPQDPAKVKVYTCGPTVYSTPHIGNYTAYIYWDLLIRILQLHDYGVQRVLNITDVGHLTSDGDEGEDKLEKGARQNGVDVWAIAKRYMDDFLTGFKNLHLINPNIIARATDYIAQDQEIVQRLIEKGYTYETKDGIYFDTAKFPHYADFARLKLEQLKPGARIKLSAEKRNPSDFAVWKFIQPGEKHAMRWDFLGRPGYPGWHLECSTIIHSELGEPIDIHAGGIDHIPVHHTNEIAQSEAAFEQQLSRYWVHCNFLTIEGEKISKSLGNVITLAMLAERDFSPLDLKLWALQGHYRSSRDFSWQNLAAAKARRLKWRNRIAYLQQVESGRDEVITAQAWRQIWKSANDDLNSPAAFAIIDQLPPGTENLEFWQNIDRLFGLNLINDTPLPSEETQHLLKERVKARQERNFKESDRLRNELEQQGYEVLDTANGQIWQYKK